jgi:UDP-N-acetylglucosamine 2-epimerase (non-hydrolysing)
MSDLLVEFGVTTNPVFATPQKEHSTILSLFTWLPKAYIGIIKQLKSLDIESNKINLIIHGDTLTTAIGALAGKRVGAHVVHLESGLTSNKFFDPFPEELVRRFVFRLSNTVMCPDAETTSYMMQKYPQKNSIDTGGNTILDSIRISGIKRSTTALCSNYIVASLHRFQNIYSRKRLLKLVEILKNISENHLIYFVLHPATRKRLIKTGLIKELEKCQGVKLIPRLAVQTKKS